MSDSNVNNIKLDSVFLLKNYIFIILIIVVSLTQLSTDDVITDKIIKIYYLFNIKCSHQSNERHSFLFRLNDKI